MNELTKRAIQIAQEKMNAMPSKTAGAGLDQMKATFQNILNKRGTRAALDAGLWGGGTGLVTYGVSRALGKSRGRSLANAGILGGTAALGRAGVEYRNEIGDKLSKAKDAMEGLMNRVRQNLPSSKGKGTTPAAPAAAAPAAAPTKPATPATAQAPKTPTPATPAKASTTPAAPPVNVNEPKGAPSAHQEGFNAVNGPGAAPTGGTGAKNGQMEKAKGDFQKFLNFWKDAYQNAGVKPDDGTSQSAAGIKKTKEALSGMSAEAAAAANVKPSNPAYAGDKRNIDDAIDKYKEGKISLEDLQRVMATHASVMNK